jgi:hypothetical protein
MTIATELGQATQSITDISRDVPAIRTAVDRIDEAFPTVYSDVLSMTSNVQDLKAGMNQMRDHIQRSEEHLENLPIIRDGIDILPSTIASSIMLQFESHFRERQQREEIEPRSSEMLEKIDALVGIENSLRVNTYSIDVGTRN